MTIELRYVPTEFTAQTWPLIEPLMAKMDGLLSCDYTLDQAKAAILTGQWLLTVGATPEGEIVGVCTFAFLNRPNDRVAFITAFAGRGVSNPKYFTDLCNIVRAHGATKIQGHTYNSLVRLGGHLDRKSTRLNSSHT